MLCQGQTMKEYTYLHIAITITNICLLSDTAIKTLYHNLLLIYYLEEHFCCWNNHAALVTENPFVILNCFMR